MMKATSIISTLAALDVVQGYALLSTDYLYLGILLFCAMLVTTWALVVSLIYYLYGR